jgi:hypothetical protein
MNRVWVIGVAIVAAVLRMPATSFAWATQSGSDQAATEGLPTNIRPGSLLEPIARDVFALSPTFRAQCQRIGEARYVRIELHPISKSHWLCCAAARTNIHRYAAGAIVAIVEIPVPLPISDYAALLGHEFEHVLEQIDRVDLATMARARSGAWRLEGGSYETRRALDVGQIVASELQHPPVSDPLARSAHSSQPSADMLPSLPRTNVRKP